MSKFITGFTLIELMITVTLLVTLTSLSVPLISAIESFKLDYLNQRIYSSVTLAKSESIKRNMNVSLCRSVTGTNCDTSDSNWADGWLSFIDINNNNSVEPSIGEQIIRVYPKLNNTLRLTTTIGSKITYESGKSTNSGKFTLCNSGSTSQQFRIINITLIGRTRMSKEHPPGGCP